MMMHAHLRQKKEKKKKITMHELCLVGNTGYRCCLDLLKIGPVSVVAPGVPMANAHV